MKTLALIGPRGAGKSAVSHGLADHLGLPLRCTDRRVEEQEGTSLTELFAARGEAHFRVAEASALGWALADGPCVLDAGGGIILAPENRQSLKAGATVFYLTAAAVILYKRISKDPHTASTRPPLTGLDPFQEMAVTLAVRDALYRETAHHVLDTSKMNPDEVRDRILQLF